jgi:hypothetical protein
LVTTLVFTPDFTVGFTALFFTLTLLSAAFFTAGPDLALMYLVFVPDFADAPAFDVVFLVVFLVTWLPVLRAIARTPPAVVKPFVCVHYNPTRVFSSPNLPGRIVFSADRIHDLQSLTPSATLSSTPA